MLKSVMKLDELKWNWDELGKEDPLWAILTRQEMKGNQWEIQTFFETGQKRIHEVFAYLDDLQLNVAFGSALDFGCGVGRLTQPLATKFKKVVGVDIAPSMLTLANQYNSHPESCSYHHNDQNHLAIFQDDSFDFILSIIVLQHMPPTYAMDYIVEFVRTLKHGGLAFFQLPDHYIGPVYVPPKLNLTQKIKGRLNQLVHLLSPPNSQPKAGRIAHMDMYGIPKKELIAFLNKLPIEILDVTSDSKVANNWVSNQYIIRKK